MTEAFEMFYKKFPVKKDRIKALKTWNSRKLDNELSVVMWALRRDAADKRQMKIHKGWAPEWKYPQGWLSALDLDEAKRAMLEEQQAKLFNQDSTEDDNAHYEEIRKRHYEAVRKARENRS